MLALYSASFWLGQILYVMKATVDFITVSVAISLAEISQRERNVKYIVLFLSIFNFS